MTITLELIEEGIAHYSFKLPINVVLLTKKEKLITFKMTSPSNLTRALNEKGQQLYELFLNKEIVDDADWTSAVIRRRKIKVKKLFADEKIKNEKLRILKEKSLEKSRRSCQICGVSCYISRKMIGCCSEECRLINRARINESIRTTHWCKSERYEEISSRRLKTRKDNDVALDRKYTPWNKGTIGLYSLEYIEKIRKATQSQFHRELFKKTLIEKKVEDLLISLGVKFKYSFILSGRQFDFFITHTKSIIETHGDFWHGNPATWGEGEGKRPLRDHQIMKRLDDKVKERIVRENGYEYFEFWEYDIHHNWENCVSKIKEILNGNH